MDRLVSIFETIILTRTDVTRGKFSFFFHIDIFCYVTCAMCDLFSGVACKLGLRDFQG